MASAWGTSWSTAWANSWGFLASVVAGGGTSKKKKRKTLTLPRRWSDEPLSPLRPEVFVAPAVRVQAVPMQIITPQSPLEGQLLATLEARAKREKRARQVAKMVLAMMDEDE